jgi:DNA-binding LytR/AlgR family response regulator
MSQNIMSVSVNNKDESYSNLFGLTKELDSITKNIGKISKDIESFKCLLPDKIFLPTANGILFVRTLEVVYCEADSNYTNLYLRNGQKITVSKTLKDIESLLPQQCFYRVHSSFIINLSYIQKYNKGQSTIVMENGKEVYLSKRKKEGFSKRLGLK